MQMLLALMDEAYTGSTIGDGGADSESEDSSTIDAADPVFLELLKDENDGLVVCSHLLCLYHASGWMQRTKWKLLLLKILVKWFLEMSWYNF